MSFGRRTLNAAGWQTWIGVFRLSVGLVRFVVLARILAIETFGEFGLATAVVGLSIVVPRFGLTAAFLHRGPQTRDEEPAASVLFTLRLGLMVAWAVVIVLFAVVSLDGGVRTAVLVLAVCQLIAEPAYVPRLLHIRRLDYPRIAIAESLSVVAGTVVAVALALSGAGLWALLAPSVIHAVLEDMVFLGPGAGWRPRIVFNREISRYLLGFGSRNLLAGLFDVVIEKVPELWTGLVFGTARLGIYNRASRLVSFPRKVTVDPLVSVLPARFSELKERPREFGSTLVNALSAVGIGGGLLAIALWATAPWMIETLIGARWMPVVSPFRILVALVVLEPIRLTLSSALVALGEPGRAAWIRGSQAVVLVPAVWVGAALAELEGVAAAVVLSSAIGVVALVLQMWQRSPASAWIGRS